MMMNCFLVEDTTFSFGSYEALRKDIDQESLVLLQKDTWRFGRIVKGIIARKLLHMTKDLKIVIAYIPLSFCIKIEQLEGVYLRR
jgi:hypothetical protein